jgi:hypothetical protein
MWRLGNHADTTSRDPQRSAGSELVDLTVYEDAISEHVECALSLPRTLAFDSARADKRLASEYRGLERAVGLHHGEYELVDAHTCQYGSRVYAHLVLRRQSQSVSLLIEKAGRGRLPSTPTIVLPGLAGPIHTMRFGAFTADAFELKSHKLFVVSDLSDVESQHLTQALVPAAVDFLQASR